MDHLIKNVHPWYGEKTCLFSEVTWFYSGVVCSFGRWRWIPGVRSAIPGVEGEAVLPEEVVVVGGGVEQPLQQGVQRVRLAGGHRVAVPPILLQGSG